MSLEQPIMLDKFERGQLRGTVRNVLTTKSQILISVDLFKGKERVCWDCGNIRVICVLIDLQGNFIRAGEGCEVGT